MKPEPHNPESPRHGFIDPALARCTVCRHIAVSCDGDLAVTGQPCCAACDHD